MTSMVENLLEFGRGFAALMRPQTGITVHVDGYSAKPDPNS
jgi:hypothetical protein